MSLTIDEFCRDEKISRSTYYKLRRLGKAPREMDVLTGKRISPEAHRQWRADREADAQASATEAA